MSEMHSETWWIKLSEGTLTAEEQAAWDAHRASCSACAREWAAWQRLDEALRWAPRVPALPADFARRTAALVSIRQRRQPRWVQLVALVGFALLSVFVWALVLGPTFLRLAYCFEVTRLFAAELARILVAVAQWWQTWRLLMIPVGGVLALGVTLWLLLPWAAACVSGLMVYVQSTARACSHAVR